MTPQFWKRKRVFITGHTGFKGAWLSLWLQHLGAELTGFALPPPTDPNLFHVARVGDGMASMTGDIRDAKAVVLAIETAQPEIVIHMAAQPMVREAFANPVETYEINVIGTVNVLEAVRTTPGVRAVINVTTDKCYQSREGHQTYRESDPLGGDDPYSNSKACAELATNAYRNSYFNHADYSQHGVGVASVRAGNVIGGGDWGRYRLVPDMIRAFAAGEPVSIRSPHALRPWIHVLEPLGAYLELAERLHADGVGFGGAWNFSADGKDMKPVEWMADRLVSLWGDGASWTLDPDPEPPETSSTKLDCSKAQDQLGWRGRWDLERSLSKLVEWHKAHIDGQNMHDFTLRQIATFVEEVTTFVEADETQEPSDL